MTHDEARLLAADGLVEIGAHTVTHPPLAEFDVAARFNEITKSKTACEALTGAPVAAFAYPYGNFDANVRRAVKAAGFSCACSGDHSPVVTGSDVLALPRIQVRDWNGDRFERALHEVADS
jgi:peptidoglycan/xylan/chitin deacetylase (PgdA/CDA1 family)